MGTLPKPSKHASNLSRANLLDKSSYTDLINIKQLTNDFGPLDPVIKGD